MKATTIKIAWDKEDIRSFEYALKVVLNSAESAAQDKEDYKAAFNRALDHLIDQIDMHREE